MADEEVNLELIDYKLEENKRNIEEVKSDLTKMTDSYNKFNDVVIAKMTEMDTKMKMWALGGSTIVGLIIKFTFDKLGG